VKLDVEALVGAQWRTYQQLLRHGKMPAMAAPPLSDLCQGEF
jgi:hypothetical protein